MPTDVLLGINEYDEIQPTVTKKRNTGEMGKDEFLNLLVTQLKYQDPLNPMDDKEFISQMAQFSSLEQMQNLNNSFQSARAFGLIGKYIVSKTIDEATLEPKVVEGQVDSVRMSEGKTYVVVGDIEVAIDEVTEVYDGIRAEMDTTKLSEFASLIGMKVKGCVYDAKTGFIINATGTVAGLEKGVYEDYAVINGVEAEISILNDYIVELQNSNSEDVDPDFEFKKEYLESHIGKEVEVMMVDRERSSEVPVKAVLRDINLDNGKVEVVLDNVIIPIESIYGVRQ